MIPGRTGLPGYTAGSADSNSVITVRYAGRVDRKTVRRHPAAISGSLVVVFRVRMRVDAHPEEGLHRGLQGGHFFFQVADPLAEFAVVVIDTFVQSVDTFVQSLHQRDHQAAQGDADCDNCDGVRCHRGTIGSGRSSVNKLLLLNAL